MDRIRYFVRILILVIIQGQTGRVNRVRFRGSIRATLRIGPWASFRFATLLRHVTRPCLLDEWQIRVEALFCQVSAYVLDNFAIMVSYRRQR